MKKLSSTGKKWLAAGILVVLAAGITLLATFAGADANGPARVAKRFVESFNQKDFDAFCSCFVPEDQALLQQAAEAIGGGEAFFNQNYDSTFGSDVPYQDFGENVTLSVSDMETQRQETKDGTYNGMDLAAKNIAAVSTVSCSITTKGSLSEYTERVTFVCVKIDRKWYLYTMVSHPEEPVSPTDAA